MILNSFQNHIIQDGLKSYQKNLRNYWYEKFECFVDGYFFTLNLLKFKIYLIVLEI